MKKTYITIIALALASLAILYFTVNNTVPLTGSIAVLLPITGDASVYGESALKSARLADNDEGTIQTEDTALSGVKAVSALQKILSTAKPRIVVSFSSGETLALCQVTEKLGITLLSSGSSPQIGKCGEHTFSNFPSDIFQSKVIAERLNDIQSVAVFYIQNDYGTGAYNEFKKNYSGKIEEYPHVPGQTDYRTSLTKFKNSGMETVVLMSQPKEASILLSQALDLNVNIDSIYATESLKDNTFSREVPLRYKDIFTAVSPKVYVGGEQTTFTGRYEQKFKSKPTAYADYVYDNVILAKDALQACVNRDNYCVNTYIKNTKRIGATGNISFGKNMSPENKEYEFFTIKDATFTENK